MATYNPSNGGFTASNKPYATLGKPDTGKIWYYDPADPINTPRPFTGISEILSYFDTEVKRKGHFTAVSFESGKAFEYWWPDQSNLTNGGISRKYIDDSETESAVLTWSIDQIKNYINVGVPSLADGVITPGVIEIDEDSLATFTTQFSYRLGGVVYDPVQADLQLDPPDGINTRIDLIVGTAGGTYEKVTGIAEYSPVIPSAPVGSLILAQIYRFPNGTNLIVINDQSGYLPLIGGELFGSLFIKNGNDLFFDPAFSEDFDNEDSGDIVFRKWVGENLQEMTRLFSGLADEKKLQVRFGGWPNPTFEVIHTGNIKPMIINDEEISPDKTLSSAEIIDRLTPLRLAFTADPSGNYTVNWSSEYLVKFGNAPTVEVYILDGSKEVLLNGFGDEREFTGGNLSKINLSGLFQDGVIYIKGIRGSQPVSDAKTLFETETKSFPNSKSNVWSLESKALGSEIILDGIAVGRESATGANDAPTQAISNYPGVTLPPGPNPGPNMAGWCHPKVIFIEGGFAGFKYWMAITPTFGVIIPLPDAGSFENPQIYCSNDGLNWQEPVGIVNPIDNPPASPATGYWSDPHLAYGEDGYLHIWYRGNDMPAGFIDANAYGRVLVHRKSRNGVDWSERVVVYSTNDAPLVRDNLILAPAFIQNGSYWHCYDMVRNAVGGLNIVADPSTNNCTNTFVHRRMSIYPNKEFTPYSQDTVVNFTSRPWGGANDPWHMEGIKYGNMWLLLINTGPNNSNTGNKLWLAYSTDGWTFDVVQQEISTVVVPGLQNVNSYRSSIVPLYATSDELAFILYENKRTIGKLLYRTLIIKKS